MKRILLSLFQCVVFIVIFLSACGVQAGPSISTESTPTVNGYPALNVSVAVETYPSPDNNSLGNSADVQDKLPEILPEGVLPEFPSFVPEPLENRGAIAGVLFSVTYNGVIPETKMYLTRGWGENNDQIPDVFVGPSDNDIILQSDVNGIFSTNNVPEGTYYLLMAAPPYDWALGYQGKNGTVLKIEISEGAQINLGVVYIYWP